MKNKVEAFWQSYQGLLETAASKHIVLHDKINYSVIT